MWRRSVLERHYAGEEEEAPRICCMREEMGNMLVVLSLSHVQSPRQTFTDDECARTQQVFSHVFSHVALNHGSGPWR